MKLYTREHIALELISGDRWIAGITNKGNELLDGVNYVEMNQGEAKKGDVIGTVEGLKTAVEIHAPFDCVIQPLPPSYGLPWICMIIGMPADGDLLKEETDE